MGFLCPSSWMGRGLPGRAVRPRPGPRAPMGRRGAASVGPEDRLVMGTRGRQGPSRDVCAAIPGPRPSDESLFPRREACER